MPAVNEPSSDAGIADPTPLADTPAGAETDNCLVGCFDRLADQHDRPDFRRAAHRLADQVGPNGLPARLGFEAVRSRADFTTLAQAAEELAGKDDRSSALLTWSWAGDGGHRGGHAAVLIKDGDDTYLYDPKTNQHHRYDPVAQRFTGYEAQDAIAKLAIGYLKPDGEPLRQLRWWNRRGGLATTDAVGHVQGHPAGDDFARAQQDYRAQDPTTRRLDSRYAEPLGEVLDSRDPQRFRQLAADLSGRWGPYPVQLKEWISGTQSAFRYVILHDDQEIGVVEWYAYRDDERKLVVIFDLIAIADEHKGTGLASGMLEMRRYFERVGVDRIRFSAEDNGSLAWARHGTWDPDTTRLRASLHNIKLSAGQLLPRVGDQARAVLVEFMQRLEPGHPDLPEPIDILKLAAPGEPDLGRQLLKLEDAVWKGVLYLRGHPSVPTGENRLP